ncbi:hypothetical protein GF386_06810 [Candidatus Pacearchaeota archaeon]|nr:hypothetical protein [Candidatus Pacearchaeota archaeon]MBD3283791.1 hypothetical protein [Candidatus Pacearchaeota archaeon]
MRKRDIVLVIGGVSFVLLIVFLSLLLGEHLQPQTCGCPHVVSNNFIYIFILLAVFFVGSLLYYLFSLKVDAQENIINKNIEVLYAILDSDEKKALDLIIRNKGEMGQSGLSKIFGKIKSHRIIKKLINKKIIDVEKSGRINKIKLKKELQRELIK